MGAVAFLSLHQILQSRVRSGSTLSTRLANSSYSEKREPVSREYGVSCGYHWSSHSWWYKQMISSGKTEKTFNITGSGLVALELLLLLDTTYLTMSKLRSRTDLACLVYFSVLSTCSKWGSPWTVIFKIFSLIVLWIDCGIKIQLGQISCFLTGCPALWYSTFWINSTIHPSD